MLILQPLLYFITLRPYFHNFNDFVLQSCDKTSTDYCAIILISSGCHIKCGIKENKHYLEIKINFLPIEFDFFSSISLREKKRETGNNKMWHNLRAKSINERLVHNGGYYITVEPHHFRRVAINRSAGWCCCCCCRARHSWHSGVARLSLPALLAARAAQTPAGRQLHFKDCSQTANKLIEE